MLNTPDAVAKGVELDVGDDVITKLDTIPWLPADPHHLVAVYRNDFILIVLDGDDLLHSSCVRGHHHEIRAFNAHEKVHGDGEVYMLIHVLSNELLVGVEQQWGRSLLMMDLVSYNV